MTTAITRRGLVAAAALIPAARRAEAQAAWPSRPVRLIVPLVPGGTTDLAARALVDPLARALGQPVVVENRAGANGWIANEYVMRERPDGHTLIVNNVSTHGLNSALVGNRPLSPARGLMPITNLIEAPQLIVASANVPATNLAEFIAYAKAQPAPLVFASAGVGSYQHVDLQFLAARAGITLTHLPLRGAGEIVPVMLRGDAQITEFSMVSALQHIRAGRLKPLAVVSRTRFRDLPDTQTTVEAGFPDMQTTLWNGMFAPLGTPSEIITRLHAEVTTILRDPAFVASLERQGVLATPSESPAAFAQYVERDVARWTALTREFNITAN